MSYSEPFPIEYVMVQQLCLEHVHSIESAYVVEVFGFRDTGDDMTCGMWIAGTSLIFFCWWTVLFFMPLGGAQFESLFSGMLFLAAFFHA